VNAWSASVVVNPDASTTRETDEGLPHCIVAQVGALLGNEKCIRKAVIMKALPFVCVQPQLISSCRVQRHES